MMKPLASSKTILALDIGGRRIGVARANTLARLPEPLTTLINDHEIFDKLSKLVQDQQAQAIVVGLPRGMDGQETDQTRLTRVFTASLKEHFSIPVYFQDESLTSQKAEHELFNNTKQYDKGMIDALAATYILEDFLRQENSLEGVNNE